MDKTSTVCVYHTMHLHNNNNTYSWPLISGQTIIAFKDARVLPFSNHRAYRMLTTAGRLWQMCQMCILSCVNQCPIEQVGKVQGQQRFTQPHQLPLPLRFRKECLPYRTAPWEPECQNTNGTPGIEAQRDDWRWRWADGQINQFGSETDHGGE